MQRTLLAASSSEEYTPARGNDSFLAAVLVEQLEPNAQQAHLQTPPIAMSRRTSMKIEAAFFILFCVPYKRTKNCATVFTHGPVIYRITGFPNKRNEKTGPTHRLGHRQKEISLHLKAIGSVFCSKLCSLSASEVAKGSSGRRGSLGANKVGCLSAIVILRRSRYRLSSDLIKSHYKTQVYLSLTDHQMSGIKTVFHCYPAHLL